MPLLKIETLPSGAQLGLWKIEETSSALISSMPSLFAVHSALKIFKSEARILEMLSVHALLYMMTGCNGFVVNHNSDGKPAIPGWHVSISHTKGYAAVILSKTDDVAVDIEYFSPRVSKIADRFIRNDEDSVTLSHQLINWSAKETVYKYFSSQNLHYAEMRLRHFEPMQAGEVIVDNLRMEVSVKVSYIQTSDYVLTFIS